MQFKEIHLKFIVNARESVLNMFSLFFFFFVVVVVVVVIVAIVAKHLRFYLKLSDRSRIKSKDFEKLNWLPIHKRVSQCSLCSVSNFFYYIFLTILMRYIFL